MLKIAPTGDENTDEKISQFPGNNKHFNSVERSQENGFPTAIPK